MYICTNKTKDMKIYNNLPLTSKSLFADGYLLAEFENMGFYDVLDEASFTVNIKHEESSLFVNYNSIEGVQSKHFTANGNSMTSLKELSVLVSDFLDSFNS